MPGFLLGLALLAGADEATQLLEQERILQGACERTIPRQAWADDVRCQAGKLGLDCFTTEFYATRYYDCTVLPLVRREMDTWQWDELIFLCSEGKAGKAPTGGDWICRAAKVQRIGQELTRQLNLEVKKRGGRW